MTQILSISVPRDGLNNLEDGKIKTIFLNKARPGVSERLTFGGDKYATAGNSFDRRNIQLHSNTTLIKILHFNILSVESEIGTLLESVGRLEGLE